MNGTANKNSPLREVAALFLKLGATAFGGPAAHLALMEDEVVRRRRWLTREAFLDLVGATNLIPGPNSTELAIHLGHRRAGWPGLVVAGACFILPAALIVTALAWSYVEFGRLPAVAGLMQGVQPVVLAIVAQALWRLGRSAVKSTSLAMLASAAVALNLLGANELLVLFGSGLVMAAMTRRHGGATPALAVPLGLPGSVLAAATSTAVAAAAVIPFSLGSLFLFFLKVGSVLFGSGYVLLAFLRAGLVERWHWLTEAQLLDAIAVGQITPGPLFTTATFIGYLLGGGTGAVVATVGIFLPAFFFVAVSGPLVPRLRRSRVAGAFLDGVNVASLALMAVVTAQLARGSLIDVPSLVLLAVAGVALFRFQINATWLVLGGAGAGLLLSLVQSGT